MLINSPKFSRNLIQQKKETICAIWRLDSRVEVILVEGDILHEPVKGLTIQPFPDGQLLFDIT
jgi:hypothetical protein